MSDAAKEMSFEVALAKLEVLVNELEAGKIGLDEAVARFEEGMKLLNFCQQKLMQAEQRIKILTINNSSVQLEPFNDEGV